MILSLLIFLASLTLLLSSVPASLTGPAAPPLPLLIGKAAIFLPVGCPDFRVNVVGAILMAFTPVLAFRSFVLLRPRPAPGPTLMELEDERRWATGSLMALFLWFLWPPALRAGTAGITPAAHVFFPLLAAEQFLFWKRASARRVKRWVHGAGMAVAGGLALSLDPRWAVFLPIFLFMARKPAARFPLAVLVTVGALSFVVPWVGFLADQAATAEQLARLLPDAMGQAYSGIVRADPSAIVLIAGLVPCFILAGGFKRLSPRFPKGAPGVFLLTLLAEFMWFLSRPSNASDLARAVDHQRLADAFVQQKIPDRAEEEYLASLAIHPQDGPTSEALGRLLFNYGEGARAAAAFSRAARFEPTSERLLTDWAAAERMNGQIPKAIALLKEALDVSRGNDSLREQLATLYEKSAQPKEAAAQWKILTDHRPKDKSAWWHLCQNLVASNDLVQAHQAIESYLRLDLTEEERENAESFYSNTVEPANNNGSGHP